MNKYFIKYLSLKKEEMVLKYFINREIGGLFITSSYFWYSPKGVKQMSLLVHSKDYVTSQSAFTEPKNHLVFDYESGVESYYKFIRKFLYTYFNYQISSVKIKLI